MVLRKRTCSRFRFHVQMPKRKHWPMAAQPSWKSFRESVYALEADGENGFEGLVRRLLEAEMRVPFYLARKGDQPAGDASSPNRGVAMEAKRYSDATSLPEDKIIGAIMRALDEIRALDVFVLASTKALGQLAARLERESQSSGLDILPLSLGDKLTDFGALCVQHWNVAGPSVHLTTRPWRAWAETQLAEPETQAMIERLRRSLSGLKTQKFVSEQCGRLLAERFMGKGAGERVHNRIVLTQSIPRPKIQAHLNQWWSQSDAPIAVLEGLEGTGKTWIAAAFVERLLRDESSVVLWIDSRDWTKTRGIRDLVQEALEKVFPTDEPLCERLSRKVLGLWPDAVLLVLDGANEHHAWEAAERVLTEFSTHGIRFGRHVRLLFTSRPLAGRPSLRERFWAPHQAIQVGNFDLEEFAAALVKLAPQIGPHGLPRAVQELAVIPRYFQLCVRLEKRLASLEHVTKQVLLWADLEEKLQHGDPLLGNLELTLGSRPQELLALLARQIGWPAEAQPNVATEELRRVVPDLLKARVDLMEQRIVVDMSLDATTVRSEHVILGWALVLKRHALTLAMKPMDVLRNELLRLIEPAASNDDKVAALHTATLLTFLDPLPVYCSRSRAALFSLWLEHHNASVGAEALRFVAGQDLAAYAQAVEILFMEHLTGSVETDLIAPLALLWRDAGVEEPSLQPWLERWLRFIHPGGIDGSKHRDTAPPSDMVVAETVPQLRLSYAAIGIISFRPTVELLPALLDCDVSSRYCYMDRIAGEQTHRLPVKSPDEPLGVLLRWRYTETILSDLKKLIPSAEPESLLWFARLFRQAELPVDIGPAQDIYQKLPGLEQSPVSALKECLSASRTPNRCSWGMGLLGCQAVRRDLPGLTPGEVHALAVEVLKRSENESALCARSRTLEHVEMEDLLPWLARFDPERFCEAWNGMWLMALEGEDPQPAFFDLGKLLPADRSARQLVTFVLNTRERLSHLRGFDWLAVPLTELMLLHADTNELMLWLEAMADKVVERGECPLVFIHPLPHAFRELASKETADEALGRFEAAYARCQAAPGEHSALRVARHWLGVYSYVARPDKSVGEWALRLADSLGEDKGFRFPLFNLIANCPDLQVLMRALHHNAFQDCQVGFHSWRWGCAVTPNPACSLALKDFQDHRASLTVAGRLLHQAGRDDELRLWGRALTRYALEALNWVPPGLPPQTPFQHRMNKQGEFIGQDFENLKPGGEEWHDISSPAWGVDRQTRRASPEDKDFVRALDQYHADLRTLRASARSELVEFNASHALLRWSQLEPSEFSTFAETFLAGLWQRGMDEIWDVARFAHTVATCLLRQNPKSAIRFAEQAKANGRVRLLDFYQANSWESHELWSPELNGVAEASELRLRLLHEAPHDEALLWQVQAAHGRDNQAEIGLIAKEALKSPIARDRALGASLLAFQGDENALHLLHSSRESDSSFWVREHAAWAWDVCASEHACRRRYNELLEAVSLAELSCGLAELRPALSPMACAWRCALERKRPGSITDPQQRVYLELFWYHSEGRRTRMENVEMGRRKLSEHCRGERLRRGVSDHIVPWWKPH